MNIATVPVTEIKRERRGDGDIRIVNTSLIAENPGQLQTTGVQILGDGCRHLAQAETGQQQGQQGVELHGRNPVEKEEGLRSWRTV